MAAAMRDVLFEKKKGIEKRRLLAEALFDIALEGNVAAARLVFEVVGQLSLEEDVLELKDQVATLLGDREATA